eukprot:Lithocolla_globosa_v1_NODE_3410_length_1680_cov_11.488615.p4 type:complete len:102 gc:universal NODE_3410_length_1680_cov_11.488615:1609-1304(-)
MAENLTVLWKFSMTLPIPLWVRPRPPKICTDSSATKWATRVASILQRAMGPANRLSSYPNSLIWKVKFSNQFWEASTRATIWANFWRMTGCSISFLPKTSR